MKIPRVKKSYPFEALLVIATIVAVYMYFSNFVAHSAYNNTSEYIENAVNLHDHQIYTKYIENIDGHNALVFADNNIGIALIYQQFNNILPWQLFADIEVLAATINTITLLVCFFVYRSICNALKLGSISRLSFFANTSLLYFTQLINKDLFTIFLLLFATYCGLQKKNWLLLALLPIFFLVRQQLVIFILLFLVINSAKRQSIVILLAYIITSLIAATISNNITFIEEETLGDGFSSLVNQINKNYHIGYLLLNPIRIIQFAQDALLVFFPVTESKNIDFAKILRIPPITIIITLSLHLIPTKNHIKLWKTHQAKALTSTVIAFILTWLMNPTINARYVMLIVPTITILALYTREHENSHRHGQITVHRHISLS